MTRKISCVVFKIFLFVFSRTCNSKDKDNLILFRGQFTISLDRARKGTFYKYVVVKKGTVYWEDLPEFPPHYYNNFVDRALKIPEEDIKPGGK